MSQESRKEKQKNKRQQKIKYLGLAAMGLALIVLISYVLQKQKILDVTIWTKEIDSTMYFFKAIDDIRVDGLSEKNATFAEGTKINGYSALSSEALTVNTAWVDQQIKTIQHLLDIKAYEDWNAVIEESLKERKEKVSIDFSGMSLPAMAPYIGSSAEELAARLEKIKQLGDGNARQITLQGLSMKSNGCVFFSTTNRKQVLNENYLPYLNKEIIKRIKRSDGQSKQALSVIGNEHIFAVAVIDSNLEISGEDQMAALKTANIQETKCTDLTYYKMLANRADLARQYPMVKISLGDHVIDAKLVNAISDGNDKIITLMIMSNLLPIIDQDSASGVIQIQRIRGYVVPRSAVKKIKDGTGTLTLMERTYFPEEVQVNITKEDVNDLILSVDDNPGLSEGDSYKLHP